MYCTNKVSHRNTHRHTTDQNRLHVYAFQPPFSTVVSLPTHACNGRGSLMDSCRIQIYAPGLHIVHLYKQHINLCSSQEEYPIFQGCRLRQQLFSLCDKRNFVKMKAKHSCDFSNSLQTTKKIIS